MQIISPPAALFTLATTTFASRCCLAFAAAFAFAAFAAAFAAFAAAFAFSASASCSAAAAASCRNPAASASRDSCNVSLIVSENCSLIS